LGLSIDTTETADAETWDEVWRRCSFATYFHSREWAELWSEYTDRRLRPAARLAVFSDGASAVLPVSEERHRRSRLVRTLSSPMGTYGGWIAADELGPDHRALLTEHLANGHRDLFWRVNPFDPLAPPETEIGRHVDEVTQAVPLSDGFEAVLKAWSKGHRSAARKAKREGVTTEVARDPDDWRAFSEVYAGTVRRWGAGATSSYGARLFEILAGRDNSRVRLWLARYQRAVIAGALCLYSPGHVAYWLGGAAEEYFHLRPVHLLMHDAIEDACRQGLVWFDMNPSGGLEGVMAFKKGFGTVKLKAPVVARRSARARVIAAIGRALGPLRRR
jgi:CelD/BcsL family acetyltransferase involved in cellulose biosynthesis